MAEYNDVIKQFKRMCKSVTPMKCTRGECPMGCENIGQCRKIAFEQPAHFAATVMRWAKENPEPVYPTWLEWLKSMGVIPYMMGLVTVRDEYGTFDDGHVNITENALKEIPADIAQKLGIEPKEG